MKKALSWTKRVEANFIYIFTLFKWKYRLYIKRQTQCHITKQLLTSISVDTRIYQWQQWYSPRPKTEVNITFDTYSTSVFGLGEYHFFRLINIYVNLTEVNNCIICTGLHEIIDVIHMQTSVYEVLMTLPIVNSMFTRNFYIVHIWCTLYWQSIHGNDRLWNKAIADYMYWVIGYDVNIHHWVTKLTLATTYLNIGPRQANLCLWAFHHDKF